MKNKKRYTFEAEKFHAIAEKLGGNGGFIALSGIGEIINIYNIDNVKLVELDDDPSLQKITQIEARQQQYLSSSLPALGIPENKLSLGATP